jgi:hypothetical protein
LNDLQQLLDISPFLIWPEDLLNKLAKEAFLFFINDVDVGELALKGILAVNSLIQDTAQ